MQKYIKEDIDARSLPEIWQTLPEQIQAVLRSELSSRIGASRTTIYYWCTGQAKPTYMSTRRQVAQAVKKITNINVHAYTLFP
ncbi:MAG: hypothetical protein J5732_05735 [Bacteroidaceae bacterium]|nr:hypothetical protein [Bacteroidaceae bacterium]